MNLADLLFFGAVISLQSQNCHNYSIKEYKINRIKRNHESGAYQDRLSRHAREEPNRLFKVHRAESDPPRKLNHRLYPDTRKKNRNNIAIRGYNGIVQSTRKPVKPNIYATNDGIALIPDHLIRHFEVYAPHHQRRNVNGDGKNKQALVKHEENSQNLTQHDEITIPHKTDDHHNDLSENQHLIVPISSKNEASHAPMVQPIKLDGLPTPSHFEVNYTHYDESNSPIKHEENHTPVQTVQPGDAHPTIHGNDQEIYPTHEEHNVDVYYPKHEEIHNITKINIPHKDEIKSKPISVSPHVEIAKNNIKDVLKAAKNASILFYEEADPVKSKEKNIVKVPSAVKQKIAQAPINPVLLYPGIVPEVSPTITSNKQMPKLTSVNIPKTGVSKPLEHVISTEHSVYDDGHHHNFEEKDTTHDLKEIKPEVMHENIHIDNIKSNLSNKEENSHKVTPVLSPDLNNLDKLENCYTQTHSISHINEHHDNIEAKTNVEPLIVDAGNKINKDSHDTIIIQDQNCEEVLEKYKPEASETLATIGDSGYVPYYSPQYEDTSSFNQRFPCEPNDRGFDENSYMTIYYDCGYPNPYYKPMSDYNPMNYYGTRFKDSIKYNSGFRNDKPKQYYTYNDKDANADRYKDRVRRVWNNRQIVIKRNSNFDGLTNNYDLYNKRLNLWNENNNAKYRGNMNQHSLSVIANDGYYTNQNTFHPYDIFRLNGLKM